LTAANGAAGQVNLIWADASSAETGFEVQRRIGLAGLWVSNGVAAANAVAYTDASAPALTELWYRVRAINASTQSVWSAEAAVITAGNFATPASLAQTMPSNTTAQASVVLTNVASAAQNFSVSVPGGSGVYAWADTSGSFAWQDISGTGSLVSIWNPNSDDGLAQVSGSLDIPLGLTFLFYGQSYTSVRIHSNGYLAFNSDTSSTPGNAILPGGGSIPQTIIAALWDDLVVDGSSSVYFQKTAADTFIVQYQNVLRYLTTERSTFQVVLKSDGTITVRYKNNTNSGSYTIGLNNQDGTKGPQVSYNTAYLPTTGNNINRAITFTPPVTWLSLVTAQPVAVTSGGSAAVTFQFNSAGLANGVYSNTVSVTSDLARQPAFTIPVQLTVAPPGSSITVTSSLPTSTYGQSVTLTATVTGTGWPLAPTPSGSVTFKDGLNVIGTGVLSGSGATATASLGASNLTVAGHSLTALFAGDANYPAATSGVLAQTILPRPLTPAVTVSNKIYDATTTASIATRGFVPGGVVGSDNVVLIGGLAVFVSPNVGNAITVNVTNLTLGGTASTNYVLSSTSASTTANIIAPTPATLANAQILPGGQFGFSFTSTAGQRYTVWTSTNLVVWDSLTNFLGDGSGVTITDPATNWPAKYYRLISP
jgi:hypothetical protein